METNTLTRSLLLVDPDLDFLSELRRDPHNQKLPLVTTTSGKEAQLVITNPEVILAGVFISPKVRDINWSSIVRSSVTNRPATPLYVIAGPEEKKEFETLGIDTQRLGIKKFIEKPFDYKQLVDLVAPIALSFDAQAILIEAKNKKSNPLPSVQYTDDYDYLPIRADDFLSGSNSLFDVFIRLSSGKFLKLLEAGDAFTPDRIEGYLKKGVHHFYIKREVQLTYLAYCDHLATALLKQTKAPIEIKVSQTLNHGEEVMKFMVDQGVTEENIVYATRFVSNVRELTQQVVKNHDGSDGAIKKFLNNVAAYEHGVGTAMIAGILGNALQIVAENPAQIVGMAAMFHDVGLEFIPEELRHEDESTMTAHQRALFQTHPRRGAEYLSGVSGFRPAALQAIEQHHMRLHGKGFPARSGSTPVSRISEIIGISDEFNQITQKCLRNPELNMISLLEENVFPYFSLQLVKTFKETFFPTRSFQRSANLNAS